MTTAVVYGARRGPGETRKMVKALYKRGRTIREIAEATGISAQGVQKHVRNLVADGEVTPRRP